MRGQRNDRDRDGTARVGDDGSASLEAAVDVLLELREARLQLLWLRARLLSSPRRREPEHLTLSLTDQTDATETALSCVEAVLRAVEPGR